MQMKIKEMPTYIKLSIDTRRKNTKTSPLIFHMTHNRKTTSVATGHQLAISEWDRKRQKIEPSIKELTTSPDLIAQIVDILTYMGKQRDIDLSTG